MGLKDIILKLTKRNCTPVKLEQPSDPLYKDMKHYPKSVKIVPDYRGSGSNIVGREYISIPEFENEQFYIGREGEWIKILSKYFPTGKSVVCDWYGVIGVADSVKEARENIVDYEKGQQFIFKMI